MEIYLSVNNRAEVIQLPVLPSSFLIAYPQSTESFETVSGAELKLIGDKKPCKVTISSYFPNEERPYSRCFDMTGWDFVEKVNKWVEQKLPIRLIVTDTPINMAVVVTDEFTAETKAGDIYYSLPMEECEIFD